MRRALLLLVTCIAAWAQTFTKDVAPILYQRCVQCHRPNDIAPMSLLDYKSARPWAKSIRESVLTRKMPPWFADPAIGHFSNDISLAPEQIAAITAWVDAGMPAGNPHDAPPPPHWTRSWPPTRSSARGSRAAAAQSTYDSIHVKSTQSPDAYALGLSP